jgi:hypothetical protein
MAKEYHNCFLSANKSDLKQAYKKEALKNTSLGFTRPLKSRLPA